MHIVVCAKQIPNPETASSVFKVDEQAGKVIPVAGMPLVVSPFDEQAMEAALRIREKNPDVKITIMSLGPASAREVIKYGLSMGADEGVLLTDTSFDGGDGYTTALVLAQAIRKMGDCDLVLTGRQAADWDAGIVGCGIAELLGVAAITFAKTIQVQEDTVRVDRVLDDGFETVETRLPAVVTISNELGTARSANLRETMRAARKPVKLWTAADIGLDTAQVGSAGARKTLERLYVPVKERHCEMIQGGSPEELAKNLIARLQEAKLI